MRVPPRARVTCTPHPVITTDGLHYVFDPFFNGILTKVKWVESPQSMTGHVFSV